MVVVVVLQIQQLLTHYGKLFIVLQAKKVPIPSETPQYPNQMPKSSAPSPARRPAAKSRPQRVDGHGIVGAPLSLLTAAVPPKVKDHPTTQ